MDHEQFETVVREAVSRLPEWVREALQNIDILVTDEADEHIDPDGQDLLGIYLGVPLTERDSNHAGELPDVIYIFRRPHLEMNLPPDELRDEIAKTLIHEIAHYFGIDDEHLEEIGWG